MRYTRAGTRAEEAAGDEPENTPSMLPGLPMLPAPPAPPAPPTAAALPGSPPRVPWTAPLLPPPADTEHRNGDHPGKKDHCAAGEGDVPTTPSTFRPTRRPRLPARLPPIGDKIELPPAFRRRAAPGAAEA